ncbi:MAG: type II toxin-antitoxin system PemK/MazF family toxin [Chloroflexi bacterium]|nr:type II toxin-antitoxin system PemK/MazF family toxin [Chloroflexota bacterium]
MDSTVTITVSVRQAVWEQAERLARPLNIPPAHLIEVALTDFVERHQARPLPDDRTVTALYQGDIYWIQAPELGEHPHPYVIIQDDVLNRGRIPTVVVCALTTNRKQFNAPGNVLLEVGEANLPKQSAVVVSKVSTVEKSRLGEYIGTLSSERISQIFAGMRFLQLSFFV